MLRSEKPIFEGVQVFRGRAGIRKDTRAYYLYVRRTDQEEVLLKSGHRFVPFRKELLDVRGGKVSKSKTILNFLKENAAKAFYSTEVSKALAKEGVKASDIMSTIRRYERFVYVRGYKTDQRQTPFKEGYVLSWIDQEKPRDQAIEEAVVRTNTILANKSTTNPIIERIQKIRDAVIESTKLRNLVGFSYLQDKIGCSENELEHAVERTLQLYPDLREIKLFNVYRYYYHTSMSQEDLQAAISMKENYIRMSKGRDNRVGHNWEAVPEWFIDRFTTGARFWTQKHRTGGFDQRRITIHLFKSVGGRRNNAEVDRVWEVTPGIFSQPIIYVLECKWGFIQKKYLDDFFEVLRWSKEFGADSSEGRVIKQGIVGVFAGSAFNPKETVKLKDQKISLASYASRLNIQLLKACDFNIKLREKGIPKDTTAQKICKAAEDEKEVREILEVLWENPEKSELIIAKIIEKNKKIYDFERMLEVNSKDE